MVLPKILVAYKEATCEKDLSLLYKRLKYYLSNEQVELNTVCDDEEIKEGSEYDLHINTKYYEANVQMICYKYHIDDVDDILRCVEGLSATIYYFKSIENLDDYMKFVDKMLINSKAEINFLVYDSSDIKLPDKYEKSINKLCIDHFMELIRIDSTKSIGKESKEESGMLGEIKVGINRIVEALQCHIWSSMVRKLNSHSENISEENINIDQEESKHDINIRTAYDEDNNSTIKTDDIINK